MIDAGIRNDGRQPLYVYNRMAWGMGGGLMLSLRDEQDRPVEPGLLDDTVLPPPPEGERDLFARLAPGMFIGTRRRVAAGSLFTRAGRYTIQVEYRAALSRQLVPRELQSLPALWMESRSIQSERLEVTITE